MITDRCLQDLVNFYYFKEVWFFIHEICVTTADHWVNCIELKFPCVSIKFLVDSDTDQWAVVNEVDLQIIKNMLSTIATV